MKRNLNILLAVAAVAVIAAMLAPVIEAQCVPARKFASRNLGGADAQGERIRCTDLASGLNWTCATTGSPGAEVPASGRGQVFCSQNRATWEGTACPAQAWMFQAPSGATGPPRRVVDGNIGSAECSGAGACPDASSCDLTVFYEDILEDGSNTGFLTWRVDITPASGSTWDYRRILPGQNVIDLTVYPRPDILASSRPTPTSDVEADVLYLDIGVAYKSAGPATQPNAAIASWNLYQFIGSADPGREVTDGWTKIDTITYANMQTVQTGVVVDCMGNTTDNAFLALGVGIRDDQGNVVDSTYVGLPTEVECDPDIANPEQPTTLQQRVRRPGNTNDIRGARGSEKRGR